MLVRPWRVRSLRLWIATPVTRKQTKNILRVQVWNGDQTEFLGEGELVGKATVFFIAGEDGALYSLENPEDRPTEKILAELKGELVESKDNPKIRLDDGSHVYGCQVWWGPVEDAPGPEPSAN